jgi:hypothetical protein
MKKTKMVRRILTIEEHREEHVERSSWIGWIVRLARRMFGWVLLFKKLE